MSGIEKFLVWKVYMLRTLMLTLLLFLPLSAEEKRATVCLNMIVKNEAQVIKRCLGSVKPIIDYWVIFDTGSTDGTQDIIREFMKDIPGELRESPWVNFEHNRNEALDCARNKADYVLMMDADDFLELPPGNKLQPLTADVYQIAIYHGSMTYMRDMLIKTSLPWKWAGVLHEVLICDAPQKRELLENVKYRFTGEGARSKDPKKYQKDAAILEEALKKDPTSTRYTFYLAQSYRDAEEKEKSLEWYEKRIAMGGWDQEVYFSLLQVAVLQKALGKPRDMIYATYEKAYRLIPFRGEAVYYLSEMLNQDKKFEFAYALIKGNEYIKKPVNKGGLFVAEWTEKHGLFFQQSIAAYGIGNYQECLDICDKLLATKDFPWVPSVKYNRELVMARLQEVKAAQAA
jgi:glycosyltransferase involved in cell wall biosynthesis